MSDSAQSNVTSSKPFPLASKPFAPDDEAALREALKRCSPSTFEAAVQFRKTGNADHMPAVVIGVIERFVEPDSAQSNVTSSKPFPLASKPFAPDDEAALREALKRCSPSAPPRH